MKVSGDGVPVSALISAVRYSVRGAGVSLVSEDRVPRLTSIGLIQEIVVSKTADGPNFCGPLIGVMPRIGTKATKAYYRMSPRSGAVSHISNLWPDAGQ